MFKDNYGCLMASKEHHNYGAAIREREQQLRRKIDDAIDAGTEPDNPIFRPLIDRHQVIINELGALDEELWSIPTGTKGEKRKADVIGNAIHVIFIATSEVDCATLNGSKDKATQAIGRKGGSGRAAAMTPEHQSEIEKAVAKKRWGP